MEEKNKDQINEVVEEIQDSESMQEYEFVFDPETLKFVKRPYLHRADEIIIDCTCKGDMIV